MTVELTRRAAVAGVAALPLAATAPPLLAQSAAQAQATEHVSREFKLGNMTITSLLDVSDKKENPKEDYGLTVSAEEFARVSTENFISSDIMQYFISPTLIDTGDALVLVDTGIGKGGLNRSLQEAGVSPDAIDVVVISHMHPDHIGGLMTDGSPTFPNARYVTGSAEYNFWRRMEAGNFVGDMVAELVTPLAEKTTFVDDGGVVVPGVTTLASFGHSPGHMCVLLESQGQQLLLTADLANHYVWSFANPDWAFKFDADPEAASASRRRVLSMLVADKIPMVGYHMPFPGVGFVESRNEGFRYVAATYQLMA